MKQQTSEQYIEFLARQKKADISMLDDEDMNELTIRFMKETATKFLPMIESKDHSREIMTMLCGWMETEDEALGYKILCKMREMVIKAHEGKIEDEINYYHEQEAKNNIDAAEYRASMEYEYYAGRI